MAAGPADLQLGPRGDDRVEAPVGDAHRGVEVHAAGQFERDVHVSRTLGECLEGVERHAELLARLEIVGCQAQGLVHRPDRFGAQRRGEADHRGLDVARRVTAVAERLRRGAVELDLGAPLPVERAVGMARGGVGVDEEQAVATTRQGRRDDEDVGGVAGQNRVLASGDGPRVAPLCGARRQLR